ncbi:hypothetical protein H2198_000750 [Neophaeococcomyces mojaviensis]|uniref:Uncharacterized protein n=1 Tax=Neophaeococcomyces mojaviensis TaxID=3383035 RepID=A0ACC3AIU0_9EURO|nr:hypothetical protein H2198_000750 [Knufia sp. JES_112]
MGPQIKVEKSDFTAIFNSIGEQLDEETLHAIVSNLRKRSHSNAFGVSQNKDMRDREDVNTKDNMHEHTDVITDINSENSQNHSVNMTVVDSTGEAIVETTEDPENISVDYVDKRFNGHLSPQTKSI